jgi:hypothetical protein
VTVAVIIGTLVIIIITVLVGVFLEKRSGIKLEKQNLSTEVKRPPPAKYTLGETAATAFRVGDAQLAKLRTSQRCPECRAEMAYLDADDDRVRYDQRDLMVLHFNCPSCKSKRRLYVEHRA